MTSVQSVRSVRPLLALSLVVAAGWPLRASAEPSGFRGFAWGTTQAEVKKAEKLPIHHDIKGEISYWNFKLAGYASGVIYTFEDERLVRAHYMSRNRTSDTEEDYANYHAYQRHFDQELGPHLEESWVWADGVEPGEENLEAVASGRATLVMRWQADGNRVKMELVGEGGALQTLRVYFEPE